MSNLLLEKFRNDVKNQGLDIDENLTLDNGRRVCGVWLKHAMEFIAAPEYSRYMKFEYCKNSPYWWVGYLDLGDYNE